MSIPEDVTGFLRKHKGSAYCDDCIKDSLEPKRRQQSQRVTDAIAQTNEFVREKNTCANCGGEKFVTRAVR
jgi:hypothetical protein